MYFLQKDGNFDIYIVSAPDPQVYVPVYRNTVTIITLCKLNDISLMLNMVHG